MKSQTKIGYHFLNKHLCPEKYAHHLLFFFSIWVFFHDHSRITGLQGKGEGISLTPHYHFHPLHRQLDISRAITTESSPLHIASTARLEPGTFGFRAQVANHQVTRPKPPGYAPFASSVLPVQR